MSLAFVTMVWRDYWLLDHWVRHNANYVPRSQLYVINHGGDPEVARIAAGCNIINIPRDGLPIDLTRRRWDLLGGLTNGLLGFYDHVVCSDVDELILYAGSGSLLEHLAQHTAEVAIGAVGLNLIPTEADPADDELPVLRRHPHALLSARYSKPCIARAPVHYTIGGHGLIGAPFAIDPAILLCHLHFVTPDYAERMAARQEIVAEARAGQAEGEEVRKRYWVNWSNPAQTRDRDLALYAAATDLDVTDGFGRAAERLNAARINKGKRHIVDPAQLTADPWRVSLPETLRDTI